MRQAFGLGMDRKGPIGIPEVRSRPGFSNLALGTLGGIITGIDYSEASQSGEL